MAGRCLDQLCRDYRKQQVLIDPLSRISREAARILNLAGVQLDPDLTISEQAAHAAREGKLWGVQLCKLLDQIDPGHCDRLPDVIQTRDAGGFTVQMREQLVRWQDLSLQGGLQDPLGRIISAYRTPLEQLTLLSRWVQGEREGIRVKPSSPDASRHVRGTAVDLRGTADELYRWSRPWKELGGRWGGDFFPVPDTVHFDLG